MNILIIYAYPNHQGFNSQIFKTVKNNIPKTNKVKVLDLYQDKFDPVLHFDSNNKRRNMKFDSSTEKYRNDLVWADHLIFIFPIWWSSTPAILKGYIDRVFASGFAYEFKGLVPTALLPGKTATIITTHDTPNFYVKLFQQDYGKVLKKQSLKMCGIKTTNFLTMPYVRNSNEKKRLKFLHKISITISRIK